MSKEKQEFPYSSLGALLKSMRQKRQESLAEVSGAVEIEVDSLTAIEKGTTLPAEDILLLLISHFNIKEDEATKLWEQAGYDKRDTEVVTTNTEAQAPVMIMPGDLRIVYTDIAHIMVNDYGVVLNFMQGAGPNNQPLAVARVGMSREHAKSVLELLQRTLAETEQKNLPAPKSQTQDTSELDKQK